MKQIVNQKYKDLFVQNPRYFLLMGGRGAGRSTVASQLVNARLIAPEYFRCAIMRYIFSDIRNSIYREITDRAEENGIIDKLHINDSTMTIEYGTNTINAVGFRKSSGDQKSKLKSLANYNCVVIEEADEIPEEDFMQLDDSLRTVKGDISIILLLNPPARNHWIINRWFDLEESGVKDFYLPCLKSNIKNAIYIRTNYKDNETNLAPQSIAQYENYKITNPSHYWNMIAGYVPEVTRGKIYSNWKEIQEIPHEARLERYGLDFGYTNDPTSIIAVYRYNGGFILDEVLHKNGMLNKMIADFMVNQPNALIIADSAEPKSIAELQSYGLQVISAKKGSDSVRFGIATVQQQRISYTSRSENIKKEYENYAWMEEKDGSTINVPKPGYDHAMDAVRYAIKNIIPDDTVEKRFNTGQYVLDKLMEENYGYY